MPGISLAAFSVPLRAMVQNSEALLVTKASFVGPQFVRAPPPVPDVPGFWQLASIKPSSKVNRIKEIDRSDFSGCMWSLDSWFIGLNAMPDRVLHTFDIVDSKVPRRR